MRTRKSAAERKTEIVETTVRLADELGPDRLSTERIAQAVGITQPAIFRHFPRKQDLWQAVASWIGERLSARWTAAESQGGSAGERLARLVTAQLSVIRDTPAIPAILFSRELHNENDTLRRGVLALLQRFHRKLADIVADGRRRQEFRADLDPEAAAYLLIALVQGLALRWSLSGRGFDPVSEGRRLLQICLAGLNAPPEPAP